MNLLKFLAAILTITLSVLTLAYLPLWVYFGLNILYLGSFYQRNGTFLETGFVIFALFIGAPLYAYIVLENLIDGKKWNEDT